MSRWHRCNFEQDERGIRFCEGDHDKSSSYVWHSLTIEDVESMRSEISELQKQVTELTEELEKRGGALVDS